MSFAQLLAVVDAPDQGDDTFVAQQGARTSGERLFGGQVAAQAIMAAGRTVDADRRLHSAQSTYLLPGNVRVPLHFRVTRLRDGRTFSTREVSAIQNDRVIFTMIASFQAPSTGAHHQLPTRSDSDPEALPDAIDGAADETAAAWYRAMLRGRPFDLRVPDEPARLATLRGEPRPPRQVTWCRSSGPLPDDELLHDAVITYCSDFLTLSPALGLHPDVGSDPTLQFATINHSIWFHAPVRADDWFVHEVESPWAGEGRALCRGYLFNRDGTLVASTVQEGLMRLPEPTTQPPSTTV